ncbi:MAG: RNA polymerase-binding protein DksA [Gammaproteobacteria bacterium]|nr:RNA polymerase-binding protein DksA [Gammaproteobacteria bacterium]
MAKKKPVAKKNTARKKVAKSPARKKTAAKKKVARKKPAVKKAPARKTRSKAATKKTAARKTASKAATKKKVTKKKPAQKKVTKKKTTKKKVAKKKTVTARKKAAPAKKPAARKKTSAKKAGSRPAAKKPAKKSTAKAAAEKAPAAKKPAARKTLSKSARARAGIAAAVKRESTEAVKPAQPRRTVNLDDVKLPDGYRPKPNEEYMSPIQLAYFQKKLLEWREELITESQETLEHLRTETRDVGDEAERASRESDNILELRTRDRYRKLLRKIDGALSRIDDGSYGYCEETGEEIGISRLEARPIATLTVDAQERREMVQRQFRDDR